MFAAPIAGLIPRIVVADVAALRAMLLHWHTLHGLHFAFVGLGWR